VRADLSGRQPPPPRWFLLVVLAAVTVGLLAAAAMFGAFSGPAASPSPGAGLEQLEQMSELGLFRSLAGR
jgi:hypothetical protein